jgi:flavorubredoxin
MVGGCRKLRNDQSQDSPHYETNTAINLRFGPDSRTGSQGLPLASPVLPYFKALNFFSWIYCGYRICSKEDVMRTQVDEIAPGLFRISTYIARYDLQFNQFLVQDDEPLLFHTGMKSMFDLVRHAVEKILDPATLRWIGFSHFEADECGSLNAWLDIAPQAKPICGIIGATINIHDFTDHRAHVLAEGEVLVTGRNRFRFLETPQVPHGWDASLLFEETGKTLFCSDLFLQNGNAEPVMDKDLLGRTKETLVRFEASPLANSFPYTAKTKGILHRLADLEPQRLAVMHGSTFVGDGGDALRKLAVMMKEVLAP